MGADVDMSISSPVWRQPLIICVLKKLVFNKYSHYFARIKSRVDLAIVQTLTLVINQALVDELAFLPLT